LPFTNNPADDLATVFIVSTFKRLS